MTNCIEADRALEVRISEDARLLRALVPLVGETGGVYLVDRIRQGEWRLRRTVEDWPGNSVIVEAAKRWVGANTVRARTLASMCKAEGDFSPSIVAFLIDDFGEDPEEQAQLGASFGCGVSARNESDHLNSQIAMVSG